MAGLAAKHKPSPLPMNLRMSDMETVARTIHVGGVGGLGDEIQEQDMAEFFGQYGARLDPLMRSNGAPASQLSSATGQALQGGCTPLLPRKADQVTAAACWVMKSRPRHVCGPGSSGPVP
jgi:hypothetical protein